MLREACTEAWANFLSKTAKEAMRKATRRGESHASFKLPSLVEPRRVFAYCPVERQDLHHLTANLVRNEIPHVRTHVRYESMLIEDRSVWNYYHWNTHHFVDLDWGKTQQ